LASRRRSTLSAAEAVILVSPTVAALVLTTVSLWVYLGHATLLTWIIVGSAIATFAYSLVRYARAVGQRNVRVGVQMVWLRAPHAWRVFLIVCVVWGAAVVAVGDHVTLETPTIRDGHYVTTRYGHVVRYIARSEYRDLKMGRFRLFAGIAGILAAAGATVGAARGRIEPPDDSPLETLGERHA
jgi:hypothetical protein